MTRNEAIAIINAKLEDLDEEALRVVAELVNDLGRGGHFQRPLTDRERDLIEQSKADFREGRTYTIEEAKVRSDAFLKSLRAKHPSVS